MRAVAPSIWRTPVVEQGQVEMLVRDARKMREAGGALAVAAVQVIHEYDGLHRLSLAVAEWQKVIASEGDRDRWHNAQVKTASTEPVARTCATCEHSWRWGRPQSGRRCGRPGDGGYDLVNGQKPRQPTFCSDERTRLWRWFGIDTCGPEGRYWELRIEGSPPTGGSCVSKPARPSR